jgi:hypothetical protein
MLTHCRHSPPRIQINAELVELAKTVGVGAEALNARLAIAQSGNSGNATTQAIKFATKYHRVRGVHVTPTVFVNGCVGIYGWMHHAFEVSIPIDPTTTQMQIRRAGWCIV